MYLNCRLGIMFFPHLLCLLFIKTNPAVNHYFNKSVLMRVAHDLAKTIKDGIYRERLREALQVSWSTLKRPLPVELFVSRNAEFDKAKLVPIKNKEANVEATPTKGISLITTEPKFKTKAARLLAQLLSESIDKIVTVEKSAVHYRIHGGFIMRSSSRTSGWYKFMKQLRAHLGIEGWEAMEIKRSELMALLPAPLPGRSWIDLM
jgi:hypothetical protein